MFTRKLKTADRIDVALARLKADVEGSGVVSADLVIEAIFENLEAKQALYRETRAIAESRRVARDQHLEHSAERIARQSQQPARFPGLHYFNPVALMPLVEIVKRHELDATVEKSSALAAFCRAIDKLPVPVAGTPGFLVNRILVPYLLEAMRLYQPKASPAR